MRLDRIRSVGLFLLFGLGGALCYPLLTGQTPPRIPDNLPITLPPDSRILPVSGTTPATTPTAAPVAETVRKPAPLDAFRNGEGIPPATRQAILSTQRGLEWLHRMNQPHGLFLYGYIPSLNRPLEGDNYLRQVMAAAAMARGSAFTGESRYQLRASQAILTLLLSTKIDEEREGVRYPIIPSAVCNRIAAAGMLISAVCEMPEPPRDLVVQAEELALYLKGQQSGNGALRDGNSDEDPAKMTSESGWQAPGMALMGLVKSLRLSNAPWKLDLVRKALPYYRSQFRNRPDSQGIGWMSAAFSEAFIRTKEPAFAEFVIEMNDWLLRIQLAKLDPNHAEWQGGFPTLMGEKFLSTAPSVESASAIQSLAEACRMIRYMTSPDTAKYEQYRNAVTLGTEYLIRLQFTEDNTLHISQSYRSMMLGGFHRSHQDGNLRIDATAGAVLALTQFLLSGAAK